MNDDNENEEVSRPQKATKQSFEIIFKWKVVAFTEANSKAMAVRVFKVDRNCVQIFHRQLMSAGTSHSNNNTRQYMMNGNCVVPKCIQRKVTNVHPQN